MGGEPSRRGHWSSPPPRGAHLRSCLWPTSEHSTTSATSASASAIHANTPLLSPTPPSFADRLSDEIVLRIWQYLGVLDIVRLQAVCRRLSRLARDPQIWKQLFIQTFVLSSQVSGSNLQSQPPRLPTLPDLHSLLRSPDNFPPTPSIRGLPQQYVIRHDRGSMLCNGTIPPKMFGGEGRHGLQREVELLHDLDWQALFRVSSNWQRGNFAISELSTHEVKHFDQSRAPLSCMASNTSLDHQPAGFPSDSTQMLYEPAMEPERAATLVDSVGQFIFIALRSGSHQELFAEDAEDANDQFHQLPCVKVYRHLPSSSSSASPSSSLPLYEIKSQKLCMTPGSLVPTITDIKADTSSGTPDATEHRLFVAYSSGDWSVFDLKFPGDPAQMPGDLTIHETHYHPLQTHAIKKSSLITMSSFHYPILATCSADFSITFYGLQVRTELMSKGAPSVSETTQAVTVLRHMQGLSCHWPATMRLSQIPIFHGQEAASNRRPAKRRRYASPPLSRSNSNGVASTVESFSQMKKQRSLRRQYDRGIGGLPSPASETQHLESCASAQKAFRLDVAYSSPSYPDNWAVSLQEIIVIVTEANPGIATVSSRYATARPRYSARVTKGPVTSSRCRDHQNRSVERPIAPAARVEGRCASRLDSSPGVVQNRITSISNHEGLLVVGLEDHALEVYNISGSRSSLSLGPSGFLQDNLSPPDLSLEHRQSLHSHHGSVHSVALNSQRIVSGGKNGDIQVWASPRGDVGRSSSGLAHVVTLRSPLTSGASTPNECTGPLTLFQLIRHLKGQGPSAEQEHCRPRSEGIAVSAAGTNVIKWVSTTFDRLLSVVSGPSSCCVPGGNSHLDQHHSDTCTSKDCSGTGTRERVQVWNFAV